MGGLPRAVVGTAVGAGMVGVALALWSPISLAAAGPDADEPRPLTVIPETGPPDLYPGFDGGDVHVRLKNPNPYPVTVDELIPGEVTSSDPDACPPSSIAVRPASGLGLWVPARSTTGPIAVPDVVSMAGTAPDGCRSAGFTIELRVAGS